MHMLRGLFYLITALHASGFTITHLQEHNTTLTTASGNRYTVLLSVAIVMTMTRLRQLITQIPACCLYVSQHIMSAHA